jgi:hypothetical protein
VAWPFVAHVAPRNPSQLVMNQRDELIERRLFSASPG